VAALARVVEASQRMLTDRMELIRLEVKQTAASAARAAVFGGGGLAACALGWLSLMVGIGLFLTRFMPGSAAFALIGVVHLAAGGLLLWGSRKAPHAPQLDVKPEEKRELESTSMRARLPSPEGA